MGGERGAGPGTPLMAAGGGAGVITVWDLEKRRLLGVLRQAHDAPLCALHFFVGEPRLMSSAADNSIKQWVFDSADGSGRLLRFRAGHAAPPVIVRHYGEDGTRLLSAGACVCPVLMNSSSRHSSSSDTSARHSSFRHSSSRDSSVRHGSSRHNSARHRSSRHSYARHNSFTRSSSRCNSSRQNSSGHSSSRHSSSGHSALLVSCRVLTFQIR